jgi:transcriptional regulator with XRE-family HTH domain
MLVMQVPTGGNVETFGEVLRSARAAAGLNQSDLARAAMWRQSQISRAETNVSLPDEAMAERLDKLLKADGRLLAAYQRAANPNSDLAIVEENAHWDISEFMRHTHRTDVGKETIEQLELVTEQLCCEYAWRDASELRTDAQTWLRYISKLVEGRCTLREHRDLLVLSGWLTLLLACLEYDLGRARQADFARVAANRLGKETSHGELVGWSFELSSWFALTQGRLRSVPEYAEAGTKAAPNSSVVVQLAAQAAKAHARMGDRTRVQEILDDGFRMLAQHDNPTRPENHFVIDPSKWDFYAMDCYRLVRDDKRASAHAREVIELSQRPDGTERAPMRAAEARLTLAVTALRDGDIEAAAEWTKAALDANRRSVAPLSMIANEVTREVKQLYANDPSANAIIEPIRAAHISVPQL